MCHNHQKKKKKKGNKARGLNPKRNPKNLTSQYWISLSIPNLSLEGRGTAGWGTHLGQDVLLRSPPCKQVPMKGPSVYTDVFKIIKKNLKQKKETNKIQNKILKYHFGLPKTFYTCKTMSLTWSIPNPLFHIKANHLLPDISNADTHFCKIYAVLTRKS